MRDQDDGLCLCQSVDHLHDHLLTLRVNVGCGFIEDIDRRVVEQRPRDGKSLALSAGEITPLLKNRGLKPLLIPEKSPQVDLSKSFFHLFLRSVRFSHPQIVFHSPLKQITVVADQSNPFHQALLPDIREFRSAHSHTAGISRVSSHKDRCCRAFSTSGDACDRSKASGREFHIDAF